MKVNTLIIFLTVLFKYSQIYIGSTINIISITILGIIVANVVICLKNKKIKNTKVFIILSIVSIGVVMISKDPNFILPLLIAVTLQEEKMINITKKFLISSIVMFIVTIILSELGIINNEDWYKRDENNNLLIRNTLGFGNPNTLFLFIFGILISYYLTKEKMTLAEKVIWICIIVFFYKLTLCRTGFIVAILFILFADLLKRINKNKLIQWINRNAFLILTIISVIIAIKFGKSNNVIESLLSHRPIYWYQHVQNGISLTGNNIPIVLDNYMLNIAYLQGILVYIVYLYMFYKSIKIFNQKPEYYKYTIVIIFTLIYGISEAAINVSNNISILLIFLVYFNNNLRIKNGERNEKDIIFNQ